MLRPTLAAAVLALSACSNSALDYADAGTTALAISQGATELNPVVGIAGDAAAPVVALVVKAGVREYMAQNGYSECEIDRTVNSGSVFGLTNNLVWLAGGPTPIGLAVGGIAAIAYYEAQDCVTLYYDVIIDPATGDVEVVFDD